MQSPNSPIPPNLNAIQSQPLPSNPEALRQGQKEGDWFAQDKRKRAHSREQRAKGVIHYTLLAIIVLAGFCLAVALLTRAFHLIAPQELMWLKEPQLDTLDELAKFAATGALGGFLTKYLTRNSED